MSAPLLVMLAGPNGAGKSIFFEANLERLCLAFYIGIESSDLSGERVRARVSVGGHDVPTEKLAARYRRSLDNLGRAIACLPRVLIYDNSSFASPHRFLAEFRDGDCVRRGEGEIPPWAVRFF